MVRFLCLFAFAPAVCASADHLHRDSAEHFLFGASNFGATTALTAPPLTVLSDAQSKDKGAVCLDGTNPGLYIRQGSPSDWTIYFKGGGWCTTLESCASRANSDLGSSAHMPATFGFGGLASADAAINPDFFNHTTVIVYYCDGFSFSGDATHTTDSGRTLYFRGARILDAVIDALIEDHGLGEAKNVLVGGGSAGGLTTFMHADQIRARLSTATKVKAAPVSGFFLEHATEAGSEDYAESMRAGFALHNASAGVDSKCIGSMASSGEVWRCAFAKYNYAVATTPFFVINSALDSWQMSNILKPSGECAGSSFANCTSAEVSVLNSYIGDFMADLRGAGSKWGSMGEGGFIETCHEHVAAQADTPFGHYAIDGVALRDAIGAWWREDGAGRATFEPCELNKETPHQCNPSC